MTTQSKPAPSVRDAQRATEDPAWVRYGLLAIVAAFLGLVLILPLVSVFTEALGKGLETAIQAIAAPPPMPPQPMPLRYPSSHGR